MKSFVVVYLCLVSHVAFAQLSWKNRKVRTHVIMLVSYSPYYSY